MFTIFTETIKMIIFIFQVKKTLLLGSVEQEDVKRQLMSFVLSCLSIRTRTCGCCVLICTDIDVKQRMKKK